MAFDPRPQASRGLREALSNLKAARRKPDEADRPPPKALPGRRLRPIDGQIRLEEVTTDGDDAAA
jgi:hypothetical protein